MVVDNWLVVLFQTVNMNMGVFSAVLFEQVNDSNTNSGIKMKGIQETLLEQGIRLEKGKHMAGKDVLGFCDFGNEDFIFKG